MDFTELEVPLRLQDVGPGVEKVVAQMTVQVWIDDTFVRRFNLPKVEVRHCTDGDEFQTETDTIGPASVEELWDSIASFLAAIHVKQREESRLEKVANYLLNLTPPRGGGEVRMMTQESREAWLNHARHVEGLVKGA